MKKLSVLSILFVLIGCSSSIEDSGMEETILKHKERLEEKVTLNRSSSDSLILQNSSIIDDFPRDYEIGNTDSPFVMDLFFVAKKGSWPVMGTIFFVFDYTDIDLGDAQKIGGQFDYYFDDKATMSSGCRGSLSNLIFKSDIYDSIYIAFPMDYSGEQGRLYFYYALRYYKGSHYEDGDFLFELFDLDCLPKMFSLNAYSNSLI